MLCLPVSFRVFLVEGDHRMDKAERAAAEEKVEVDEFDENVTDHQPTPALSVSSDIVTLRTTYTAYVKSELLG